MNNDFCLLCKKRENNCKCSGITYDPKNEDAFVMVSNSGNTEQSELEFNKESKSNYYFPSHYLGEWINSSTEITPVDFNKDEFK